MPDSATDPSVVPPAFVRRAPKLIYLVTEDWYFWSHRLPMARAARQAGFDVGVATRVADHAGQIEAEGFRVHALSWRRRSLNPVAALAAIIEIWGLYRREQPDIVHHVAIKPAVLGGIAAWLAGVPNVVHALTGLGFVFIAGRARARMVWRLINPALGRLFGRQNSLLVLQNEDDRATLVQSGLIGEDRIVVIRGSGVDVEHFAALPEPLHLPITAAFVGRMLEDKGVLTLVQAYRILRRRGVEMNLMLVGLTDPENPTSIAESRLQEWSQEPGISWRGFLDDVREVWSNAHIAVLPSRREGLPMSLLEAAACGRPIVATDVPGCREIARHNENALLVPADDPDALADALERLVRSESLRRRFGQASRRMVESDLSAAQVGARTTAVYLRMLGH